jgi:hypothetical protein
MGADALHLTSDQVDQWCSAAKAKASMGAMRQLLKAYRVACHYSDTEAETEASLQITSSRVFNELLLFVLKEASPNALDATKCRPCCSACSAPDASWT